MVQRQREYDSDLRQLPSMRAFLHETCLDTWQGEPVDESVLLRLELALTEAVSNIILHSYQGQQDQSITLGVAVDDDQVCVTLQHTGQAFDPQAAAAPVFDGSREGGFGLYLIRQCVDEVEYGFDDQGRCLVRLVQKREQSHKGEADGVHG